MLKREKPGPGQESVWDYPRPPRLEQVKETLKVVFNGEVIAETSNALRVLETSHPPQYYFPPEDVKTEVFTQTPRRTFCEFKGAASYWTVKVGDKLAENAVWAYETPNSGYQPLAGYFSFYAGPFDACYVGDEQVDAQAGNFYGGWITSKVVGPFKGGPGTMGW
ncbi:MAG: DUF427 domain-containing protein [Chloroflexi bacterium]|nr:DUF427 domain-containing protein [Chloroflexota bacterium]